MIVFGSRGSDLALWQSNHVAERLQAATGEDYRIEVFVTKGDKVLDKPLPMIGGKGLFTAELEAALLDGRIDVAVHSMKDLPVEDPEGLLVGAVPERAQTADVLVYDPQFEDLAQGVVPLQLGSRVGTSSHRRRSALSIARPDLEFADVRGNVPTRIDKVRRGDYAAIVLASAGIDRLGLDLGALRRVDLPPAMSTPAPAQGALAIQCRVADARVRALLEHLDDATTSRCVRAERDLLFRLGGGCSMPLGALVTPADGGYRLQAALFASPEVHATPRFAVRIDEASADLDAMVVRAAARMQPLIGDRLAGLALTLLRPDGAGGELAASLEVAGAHVTSCALTRIEPLAVDAGRLAKTARDRAICFTSARAVDCFAAAAGQLDLAGAVMFAGGPATAAAAARHGWSCAVPAGEAGGRALAALVLAQGTPTRDVLFACAEDRHPDFEAELAAAGVDVTPLPLYRTVAQPDVELAERAGGWLVFTSPSAVRAYAAAPRSGEARHLAIGQTTAAAMQQHQVRCDAVAAQPTAAALIHSLLESSHV